MLAESFSVLVLIACLDANSFSVREDAHARLAAMGDRALPCLVAFHPGSPEQAQRVRRLLDARRPGMIRRLLARHKIMPSIYCLPQDYRQGSSNYSGVIDAVMDRVPQQDWTNEGDGSPSEEWEKAETLRYRAGTRLFVADLIWAGRREEYVARLLDRMARIEQLTMPAPEP